jgi:hypothetical protein
MAENRRQEIVRSDDGWSAISENRRRFDEQFSRNNDKEAVSRLIFSNKNQIRTIESAVKAQKG